MNHNYSLTIKLLNYHREFITIWGHCIPKVDGGITLNNLAYYHVYRYVNKISIEKSFLPKAVLDPPREVNASSVVDKCSLWGVSFWTELKKAKGTYRNLRNRVPDGDSVALQEFIKEFGDSIACGNIYPYQGISSIQGKHVNHHPYIFCKYKGFNVVHEF